MDDPDTREGRWKHYRSLRSQGLSTAQIAAQCGVSTRTVREANRARTAGRPPEILREDGTVCPCYYCGNEAEAVDVVRRGSRLTGPLSAVFVGEIRTPACNECRRFASQSRESLFERRKAAVKTRIRHKYGHHLPQVDWPESELAKLAPEFANYIRKAMAERDAVRDRLAW